MSEAYGVDWLQPPHTKNCAWCRSPPGPCDCGVQSTEDEIHRLQAVVQRLEARLAEAERLLRESLDALPTRSEYESREQYLRELITRIDAYFAATPAEARK